MFEHGISTTWLRRAQWAIYAFFGSFALGGLWYVFHAALQRDVFAALIGAGVVWGSIGLGVGMHCVTQMAALVDANQRALADLHKRAEAIEELFEQIGTQTVPWSPLDSEGNTGRSDPGDFSDLVAASTADAFPRLVPDVDDHAQTSGDAERATHPVSTPPVTETTSATSLRAAFRDAIFVGDYARALAVGCEISEAFPAGPMARQFAQVRGALEVRMARQSNTVTATLP